MRELSFEKCLPYFSAQYAFGFCPIKDRVRLIEFIDQYWKKGHALVRSSILLDWQHKDSDGHHYSFSIARDRETGDIHAVHGFIRSSQFDPGIEAPIRWGAIWKNRFETENPGLGLMVSNYTKQYAPAAIGAGVGLSKISYKLASQRNFLVGMVNRYYILNEGCSEYHLVSKMPLSNQDSAIHEAADAKRLTDISEEEYLRLPDAAFRGVPFFKSRLYYVNRYYRHPIYHYHASAIMSDAGAEAVIFWRLCEYNGACCIRIVDYTGTGQELTGCYGAFKELLRRYHAEFLDFLNIGIPKEYFLRAGFLDRRDSDIILAHYFEPFLLENDDLAYEWDNHEVPVLIFKGDADQDRPNIIKE